MAIAAWLLLSSIVVAQKSPRLVPPVDEEFFVSILQPAEKTVPLAELKVTDHVVNLTRANSVYSQSSVWVQALRRQARGSRASNGSTNLIDAEAGSVFLAPVTVGGQDFDVVVDTGSSDPWLVVSDYTCVDVVSGDTESETYCRFGATYNINDSSTYALLANESFNISYADGEALSGSMGYDAFTLGGITVPNQEFGLVDYAAWEGDGTSSGLIGFAYRVLTSAYAGTDPQQDNKNDPLWYNPLFVNMYTNQNVTPVFSLAISRDADDGGVLALGGIPDVPHSPYFASTPIVSVGINGSSGQAVYDFYSITVQGFAVSSSLSTQFDVLGNMNSMKSPLLENGTSAIVDSGTSLVYIPDDVAEAVAAAFDPPGDYDEYAEAYYVSCAATAPVFGVAIGTKIFFVNPLDMIVEEAPDECISGIQPNLGGLTILGDVWMKNVISVFDLGAEQMRFAAREFYDLTPTSKVATT